MTLLVGRTAERTRIGSLLDQARTGASGVLLLQGESGIGKSALAAHAAAEARAAGIRVVDENYDRPEWQEAFISPRSANGTIIQLAQSNRDLSGRMEPRPADAYRVEQAGHDGE